MKVVFLSNFYNHHQSCLSRALFDKTGHNYCFVETEPINEKRLKLGWGGMEKPDYVIKNYTDKASFQKCQKIIDEADVVIIGSAPYSLIEKRLRDKKLTFCYSERIYKNGYEYHKWPIRLVRFYRMYTRYKNFYMLCASAFTAADFAKTATFLNRTYRWGYFPEVKEHTDIDQLIESKKPASLLWVARFIDWKHPEAPIEVAKRLKADGYDFTLNLIGNGELLDKYQKQVKEYGLDDRVFLRGSMAPEQVREYMEQSEIFMFTSDKNEGWGAVLNESMNSGCAVVASHAIGSVPFLLKDRENGLIYESENIDMLYKKVKYLLTNPEERKKMGKTAYHTMTNEWNADKAAQRFLNLAEHLLAGEKSPVLYEDGVCAKAEILKDNWFKG